MCVSDPKQRTCPAKLLQDFDLEQVFLNVVLDDAVEERPGGERVRLGMVVQLHYLQEGTMHCG